MDQINYLRFFHLGCRNLRNQSVIIHQALVYKKINYIHFVDRVKRGVSILCAQLCFDLLIMNIKNIKYKIFFYEYKKIPN